MSRKLSSVNVVFSVSDEYVPLLSVALLSMMEFSDKNRTYNVFVLKKKGIAACKKSLSFLRSYKNLNINFVDVGKKLPLIQNNSFYTYGYVSEETYYRFFLPKILTDCDKIIYCDCDVVFCADVGELYDINIENHIIAATKNISALYNYNINGKLPDKITSYKSYFDNVLKLEKPMNYFQAGVSVYNLKKMRKENFTANCLTKLAEIKTPVFFDQCILNSLYQNQVKFLPMAWNHVWYFFNYDFLKNGVPLSLWREYDEARKQPKIIHYAGPKPFKERHRPLAGLFWKYALKTPSFEYFLKQAFGLDCKERVVSQKLFKQQKLKPAFGKNQISVMFSSSNSYIPYLGVTISSLIKNMNPKRNYDILILETEISEQHKKEIEDIITPYSNCSIRFINLQEELSEYNDLFYVYPPLSKETYYRLFVDQFCKDYDKIIYIDADTLVLSDLCELNDLDIGEYWIAASKDYVLQTRAKNGFIDRGVDITYYIKNVIAMDYKKYVQCGVMVFNIKKLKEINFAQKSVQMLQYLHNPRYVDQDVINKVCEDHILYLSPKYNFMTFYQDSMLDKIDESFWGEIQEGKKDIQIYHMPGGKPDMFPEYEFAATYFKYARETIYYERLLKQMAQHCAGSANSLRAELTRVHFPNINNRFVGHDNELKLLFVNENIAKFILKKFYYKLRLVLAFSKKKKDKYKQKYGKIKTLLKEARKQKKRMLKV